MGIIGEHSKQSTLGNVATVLYEVLENAGANADKVFEQVGLRVGRVNNLDSRLTFAELEALLIASIKATNDETLGLHFGELVHPTTFHALGIALLSSSNIRSFCNRLERYYTFITSNETINLVEDNGGLQLQLIPKLNVERSVVYPYLVQGSFSTYVQWLRSMYRRDYAPERVCFTFDRPPKNTHAFRKHFGIECEFNSPIDMLYINQKDLAVPLPAANAELARMHDEVVVKFLAKMNERDIRRRVHAQIIQLLPSGNCDKPTIARSLNMSVRTLHNRLTQENTSYQDILVQTRHELAEQYMEQKNLSVSEIAYTLGFSDCSNFSRAFQRWTGCSPTRYRELLTLRD